MCSKFLAAFFRSTGVEVDNSRCVLDDRVERIELVHYCEDNRLLLVFEKWKQVELPVHNRGESPAMPVLDLDGV